MKTAIAGLGLIGGSLAKAFKETGTSDVYALDKDGETMARAKLEGVFDGELTKENIVECEYIFIALYPKATEEFLREYAPYISKSAIVIDCGGIKKSICQIGFDIAKEYGFCFIGGHPMAGTQFSGFKYSRASLFQNASMILVPERKEIIENLEKVKKILVGIGFKSVTVSTAEEHDRIIAYTSQLAHVVSNAFVKSPNAKVHKGFSAGSYRDLTRVAKLNPDMWTELFLENSDNVARELDIIIKSLTEYRDAVAEGNAETLRQLLADGRRMKEESGRPDRRDSAK